MFHFNVITQKPHDHLFLKLGHLGATSAAKAGKQKTPSSCLFFNVVHKYVTRWFICGNLFLLYGCDHSGKTQRPHDHVLQKSRNHGATCVAKSGKPKNV